MLKEGKYAAWFRTAQAQGTGIVNLAEGRISGSDSFFTYDGSYQFDDDRRFTAVLTTRRHAEGPPTVFGLDEVEVELSGVYTGAMATCSGTARQAPGVNFEATLIYSKEDAPAAIDARSAVVKLKADKLPKRLDGRSRGRHAFVAPKTPVS